MTSAIKDGGKFWDKVADKYAAQPIGNMENYEKGLAIIEGYLTPDARVIELGAGTSSTAVILAPKAGHYVSTDISRRMVEIGQEKARDIENLTVQQFDPETQNWDGDRADMVLGLNFLHLVLDVPAVVRRANDMLVSGGVFITKSATISGRYAVMRPFIWMMRMIGKAPKLNSFSVKELEVMIEEGGFEILQSRHIGNGKLTRFIVARKK